MPKNDIVFMALMVQEGHLEKVTRHLSHESMGLLLELLYLCWISPGHKVPNDPTILTKLFRLRGREKGLLPPIINEFMTEKDGYLSSKIPLPAKDASLSRRWLGLEDDETLVG